MQNARSDSSDLRRLGLDGILIINVRSFVERRKHIQAQLSKFGLEGEFVHEFDAADIDKRIDEKYFNGTGLRPTQKSCSLKHIVALERICSRGWRRALILEDDAVLAENFPGGLKQALIESARHKCPHVIYLGCGGNQYTPRSQRTPGQYLYKNNRGRLTDSYVIGIAEASARLKWMSANKMDLPIDLAFDAMDRLVGIEILWFEDPVVEQGSKNGAFETTLQPGRTAKMQRLHFAWKGIWQRHVRQLWR
ncbi:glycosyltransferase family 25 protein [Cupriavidus basilensis]|uniref:glycosyltransferase family 25 protein n=1 Tax=Cupriavidus basilensis TaxID=68895 RepID=UPI00157BADB0|nr:glycosyltransferase family 25 protein [Cupriavidus basilensis]NUA32025.1 glycosyltransferase family 25 protein [Cupriavidus basilensis]